tara:strand:+ start:448 stop:801 length:354 start_codon:yes stop_codon:yes gene_type:complete
MKEVCELHEDNKVNNNIDISIDNKMSFIELDKIRKNIELLDNIHHIEIAKILKKNNIELTENNNGIFINLNIIPNNIISQIQNYLKYVKTQENDIEKIELEKEKIENIYFKDKLQLP